MIFEERHFEYGDFVSRDYGLIFAHADTSPFLSLSGELSSSYIFNKKNARRYTIGNDYKDSPLSFEIDIVTDDLMAITKENRRVIEKALFNRHDFQRLYVDLADDCDGETHELVYGEMKRLYLNCKLLNPERIEDGGGRVVGYKCTVECDTAYLTQDESSVSFEFASAPTAQQIIVSTDTDIDDYVYPIVVIETDDVGGYISLSNSSDNVTKHTRFSSTSARSTIIIDSELNYVTNVDYENFQMRNYPRLVDGDNVITVSGHISKITFKWVNRRFLW